MSDDFAVCSIYLMDSLSGVSVTIDGVEVTAPKRLQSKDATKPDAEEWWILLAKSGGETTVLAKGFGDCRLISPELVFRAK